MFVCFTQDYDCWTVESSSRRVRQDNDASLQPLARQQLQGHFPALLEEQFATANKHRMNGESELIEQTVLKERLPKQAVAVDDKVTACL
jgi:hypothetical protein